MTRNPPSAPLPVASRAHRPESEWERAETEEKRRRKASDELERRCPDR